MKMLKSFPVLPIQVLQGRGAGGWFVKILLLVIVFWLVWPTLGPHRPAPSPLLKQDVDESVNVAASDLAARATPMRIGRIVVLPLDRDDTGYATAALRQALFDRGVGQQLDNPFGEKARDFFGASQPDYDSADRAIKEGKSRGVDAVVFGRVRQEGTETRLDLKLGDVRTATVSPVAANVEHGTAASLVSGGVGIHRAGGATLLMAEILIWAVIVMLVPLFTLGSLQGVLHKNSNSANAFALTTYTMVDALVLAVVLLPSFGFGGALIGAAVGATAAFFYNVSVMAWVVRRDGAVSGSV
jgi:hypothetical protein